MGSDPQLNKVILQRGRFKCLFTSKAIVLPEIIKSLIMCHRTASTVMLQSGFLFSFVLFFGFFFFVYLYVIFGWYSFFCLFKDCYF